MPIDHFDDPVAARYDESEADMFAPSVLGPCVDVLADLARGGSALEFGIGTGRIALPLAERGVTVSGIDLSPAMLRELAGKPNASHITTVLGDFATSAVDGQFDLVYLVFNTLLNLTSQDEQVRCFANAADHLVPGGCFVVEALLPDLQRLPFGETFRPFHVGPDRLGFDEYDVVTQRLVSHHVSFSDGRAERASVPFRYVWPAEMDLMARMAGLTLESRWSGWDRSPLAATSTSAISVWRSPR